MYYHFMFVFVFLFSLGLRKRWFHECHPLIACVVSYIIRIVNVPYERDMMTQ